MGYNNRDNTNQKNEVATNPQQHEKCCKNDCLFKINCQYPNHHWYITVKIQTRSNARLAEFRIEEHHEERVGTNKI